MASPSFSAVTLTAARHCLITAVLCYYDSESLLSQQQIGLLIIFPLFSTKDGVSEHFHVHHTNNIFQNRQKNRIVYRFRFK